MARAEAAADAAPASPMRVSVVYAPAPHRIDHVELELPAAATLADALRASGIAERHGLDPLACTAGIWGRVQPGDTPLRDRDRVEVYRELLVDPKEARRLRYKGQRKTAREGSGEATRERSRQSSG